MKKVSSCVLDYYDNKTIKDPVSFFKVRNRHRNEVSKEK